MTEIKKLDAWTVKKSRQPKVVGVELIAGGDLNRSEKPGCSISGMEKQHRKLLRNTVSTKKILLYGFIIEAFTLYNLQQLRSSHLRSSHPGNI